MGTPRRFSIDLDLIVSKKDELIKALENVCKKNPMFLRLKKTKEQKVKSQKDTIKFFTPAIFLVKKHTF
ncbi:MAG: hypothetical protein HQK51_13405 [Oligoflexia bacterium]|nr:hypothetical protein [Oligoflexia bacterium]